MNGPQFVGHVVRVLGDVVACLIPHSDTIGQETFKTSNE